MDALDHEIAAKRRERDELAARVSTLSVEIAALERAASLRPAGRSRRSSAGSVAATVLSDRPARRGRQPGAISYQWRGWLAAIAARGERVSYGDIQKIAMSDGGELAMASIRDRVRKFKAEGIMDGDPKTGFVVTDDAVARFGLPRNDEADAGGSRVGLSSDGDSPVRDPAPVA
jgi:hypothetical protein